MGVLRKPNIFAVMITMTVLASLIQLGSLNNQMFNGDKISEWVQGLTWAKTTSEACTANCGTEVTQDAKAEKNITFTPERIVIESINLDKPVISVPLKNGTWAVQDGVANYAEGTSLVNSKTGNVGIFGHSQANAFLPIKGVQVGSTITLYGKNYKATYKVTKTDTVTPDQVDVFYPTEKSSVTLITCDGPQDIYRHMVRGELVEIVEVK